MLAQSLFANIPFPDKAQGYTKDLIIVLKQLNRIARGMLEVFECKGDAMNLRNGIEILQSIRAKAWSFSPACLRQVDGVGYSISKCMNAILCSNK